VLCTSDAVRCFNKDPTTGSCPSADTVCYVRDCYGDDTGFNAQIYEDRIEVDDEVASSAKFGGILQEYLNFTTTRSSGIFGLAFQNLTSYGEVPVMTAILEDNNLPNTFSMCLGDGNDAGDTTASSSGAGYMILGDSSRSQGPDFQGYTSIVADTYYNVNLLSINAEVCKWLFEQCAWR